MARLSRRQIVFSHQKKETTLCQSLIKKSLKASSSKEITLNKFSTLLSQDLVISTRIAFINWWDVVLMPVKNSFIIQWHKKVNLKDNVKKGSWRLFHRKDLHFHIHKMLQELIHFLLTAYSKHMWQYCWKHLTVCKDQLLKWCRKSCHSQSSWKNIHFKIKHEAKSLYQQQVHKSRENPCSKEEGLNVIIKNMTMF